MKTERTRLSAQAMAFYSEDGLVSAYKQTARFAGLEGRMATMPDIVSARLASKPGEIPWETWFTTLSAEYFGYGKDGRLKLVVVHGIGPMSTLGGIQKVYSWEYKDKDRRRRGGRITQEEFLALEAGEFGEAGVIDAADYCKRYEYPFHQFLRRSEALTDPLLKARLGFRTEEYVLAHANHAKRWHREQAGLDPENKYNLPNHQGFLDLRRNKHEMGGAEDSDPYILHLEGASNCPYGSSHYGFYGPEKGCAIAHLISTGRLVHSHHEGNESLTLDVACHEWWNGVRFVGIPKGSSVNAGIHRGPDPRKLLKENWQDLLMPVYPPDKLESIGFRALVRIGDQWFTQHEKKGESLDTAAGEYQVTSLRKVGKQVLFRTSGDHSMFFRYGIKEMQAFAPAGANAYCIIGDPEVSASDRSLHVAQVQFYWASADLTRRLPVPEDLGRNYDLMMKIMQKRELRASL